MDTDTAHAVEITTVNAAATRVPVTRLRPGDLVFDSCGRTHPIAAISPAGPDAVWLTRADLTYREHLTGTITALTKEIRS